MENSVVACPIDESELCNPLHLTKIKLTTDMKLIKCTLGFESEKLMFADTNVQNLIKFCQFNCDSFVQTIHYEILQKEDISKSNRYLNSSNSSKDKLKTKTSSALSKFFSGGDKNESFHEKEDSIIFLSKNDLEKLNMKEGKSNDGDDGWLKGAINKNEENGNFSGDFNNTQSTANKSHSVDRYQDMSKLIQERFRNIEFNPNPNGGGLSDRNTMKSFETSYDMKEKKNHKIIQKCFSLQNIEINNSMDSNVPSPDLVKINLHHRDYDHTGINTNKSSQNSQSSNYSSLNRDDEIQAAPTPQQSFITEKLLNEFYVKTKQYSKSSSSLQLLYFSIPQKMNIREKKKPHGESSPQKHNSSKVEGDRPSSSKNVTINDGLFDKSYVLMDDLPYSSVRDSIHDQIEDTHLELQTPVENIYAEICHSNTTTPAASESTSEISYKTDKHIASPIGSPSRPELLHSNKSITNLKGFKNINSIKISFNGDSDRIL